MDEIQQQLHKLRDTSFRKNVILHNSSIQSLNYKGAMQGEAC